MVRQFPVADCIGALDFCNKHHVGFDLLHLHLPKTQEEVKKTVHLFAYAGNQHREG